MSTIQFTASPSAQQAANNGTWLDDASSISSIIAAVVAVVTLLTVYVAAVQILSQRQQYRRGISTRSLGPWKSKVVSPSLLRMQTQITTPTISLQQLVEKNWQPKFTFPMGLVHQPKTLWTRIGEAVSRTMQVVPRKPTPSETEAGAATAPLLAEASWVNILEAIGLTPKDSKYYHLQSEPALVSGLVPMRWKGPDLVALCSVLGFQSQEKETESRSPMPLPMHWSGPLGVLQFRASSDSCIVEFRRRRVSKEKLKDETHDYYRTVKDTVSDNFCFKSRLWQSMGGFYLPNGNLLYLGGANKHDVRRNREEGQRTSYEFCDQVIDCEASEDSIKEMLWGRKKSKQPGQIDTEAKERKLASGGSLNSEKSLHTGTFLEKLPEPKTEKKELLVRVLDPSPNILSVVLEGEWMNTRGLDFECVHEYDCAYMPPRDVDQKTYPYALGRLRMKPELLALVKDAILFLRPDGFYFTPTRCLMSDVLHIFRHIDEESDHRLNFVVLPDSIAAWRNESKDHDRRLLNAMTLCNEFQENKLKSRVCYTVKDMVALSKASATMRQLVESEPLGKDFVWGILAVPKLFLELLEVFKTKSIKDVLGSTVTCKNGLLDCTSLTGQKSLDVDMYGRYKVPLMADGTLEGTQVLAAFLDVFLSYFWIENSWVTDVADYDGRVPRSVVMC